MGNLYRQAITYAWQVIRDDRTEAWNKAYRRQPKDNKSWRRAYGRIPTHLLTTDSVTARRILLAWDIVQRVEGGGQSG